MSLAASLDMEAESRTRIASLWSAERSCQITERQADHQVQGVQSCCHISSVVWIWDMVSILRHLCQIDQMQQHHLYFLMKLTWQDKVPSTEVFSWAGVPAVSTMVMSPKLHWAGHIVRMPDGRLPKDIMYDHLSSGACKWRGQWLQYKDILHRSLKKANIALSTWEDLAQDSGGTPSAKV